MRTRNAVAIAAASLAAAAFPAAAQQAYVTERNISFAAALEMAVATRDRCRADGFAVTITVLDRAGLTKIVLRDDGANPHTVENSMRKAFTSLTFRRPSGEWGRQNVANPASVGALHLDRITTLEGALPIRAGNEVIGSIGVSGAPGGDKDAACAQVGIDRIAKGLGG